MAWTTNPYCTAADVKTALDLQNANDDTWLQTLIGEAQANIDRYVGYSFQQDGTVPTPASRYYDGNDHEQLWIDDCLNLVKVLETTYNVVLGANGVYSLGTPQTTDITADCVLSPYNSQPGYILQRVSGLPFQIGRKNYQVQGVFGQPAIPVDISRACKLLTIHYYKRRDATYGNKTANRTYGSRTFEPVDLPEEVVCILDRYRERLFLNR